ncbi:MAG: asparagine synthase (glutamine-hydrolyzing) [Proteobacteria bacterium]|nr:asparagine synthase (glutamine-hydrolyzing) [Pseudomonadota bacterium]
MCGFAGLVRFDQKPINKDHLVQMTNAIKHRGPDGEGFWSGGNVGLGHRRLSIIDLSDAGIQPMECCDSRFVLAYNGEIYNYREIRKELMKLGYSFKSSTDSEVVLYSLIHWGESALNKFNGMFALALLDKKLNSLFLARDRYGIKPLYYAFQNNKLYFGSEQKAILANPEFNKKINKKGLLEYFTFQNFFSDQTLLEEIHLLESGTHKTINVRTGQFQTKLYWDYDFRSTNELADYREYCEELSRLFGQAVERQLVSDVEIGCYLSGGMDSGSITAIASQKLSHLKTFTCGFDMTSASGIELGFDERSRAEAISSYFSTEQYEMILKHGDMIRCMPRFSYHLEEPRVGQSYPNYYVAQLASKFVKVVFSGAGGDELFGGYPWRYYKGTDSNNFEDYIDNYYLYWQRLLSNSELKQLFSPIWNEVSDVWTRDTFKNVFKYTPELNPSPEEYINHSLYFEAKTFLHGLFVVEDKLSMSHGLETRVPFMDNDLVDFAMKCPAKFKMNPELFQRINENDIGNKKREYFQKTNDGKRILRDAMNKFLPKDVLSRAKQGFSAPDASWFAGDSNNFVRTAILGRDSPLNDIFDRNELIKLCEQHFRGDKNRRLLIWSLLNTSYYIKQTFQS